MNISHGYLNRFPIVGDVDRLHGGIIVLEVQLAKMLKSCRSPERKELFSVLLYFIQMFVVINNISKI